MLSDIGCNGQREVAETQRCAIHGLSDLICQRKLRAWSSEVVEYTSDLGEFLHVNSPPGK